MAGLIPSFAKPGLSMRDMIFSNEYMRMIRFLLVHGDRHYWCPNLNSKFTPRKNQRCIANSVNGVKHLRELGAKLFEHTEYAEGLCSEHPLALHAWNVCRTGRHNLALDTTWEISSADPIYLGAVFDRDFFDWARRKQHEVNLTQTLPYLNSGCCCLTYKPLLEGKVADYPMPANDDPVFQNYDLQLLDRFVKTIGRKFCNGNEP